MMAGKGGAGPCLLYVGTDDGVRVVRFEGPARLTPAGDGLAGKAVRGIAVHPEQAQVAYVACGLRGWGLHRTGDAGRTFETLGFEDRWVWDVAFHPGDPQRIWVGTEPPMLYVSSDAGRTFVPLPGIDALPSRPRWKFFHPPFYAGHIHGIAIHRGRAERIFAGVEHGAFIYSHDGGRTWSEALVGYDLHRVAIDPQDPHRVLAGAGEGLLISSDAGRSWVAIDDFQGKYVHAVLFDPHVRRRLFVYAAEQGTPLYRSDNNGRTWKTIGRGLPEAGPADNVCAHPGAPDVLFYAGDAEARRSRLYVSFDAGETWEPLEASLPKVWRLRSAPWPSQVQA